MKGKIASNMTAIIDDWKTKQEITVEELAALSPDGALLVAESGLFTPQDVARVADAGARALLVGESLMRQTDVEAATRALLA